MRYPLRPVILICVFLSYGFAQQSFAQRTIGVRWVEPNNQANALAELDTLNKLGISYLEISHLPNAEIWEKIDSLDYRVFGQVPISFPIVKTFAEPDSALMETISSYVNHYSAQSAVEAIGLFKFGAVHRSSFDTTLKPFVRQIRGNYSGKIYYTTTKSEAVTFDQRVDFKISLSQVSYDFKFSVIDTTAQNIGAYIYKPREELSGYLNPFNKFLDSLSKKPVPVFVNSDWLFAILDKYPDFANTVALYNSDDEFIFPTPKENITDTPDHSLIVFLLILIWGLFALNYHLSPVYRKSWIRYFTSHVFFVEDVMDRHIRSIGPSLIVILQNILLAGICTYSLGTILFSPLGLDAVFFHYPILLFFNAPSFSLFLIGCFFSLVLSLLSILWIRISNKSVRQTRQVLNLYAWPLQINFLVGTIAVALLTSGNHPAIMVILVAVFAAVHISAFIIAAIDTSKYLLKRRVLFFASSIILYCFLWVGFAVWVLWSSIPQVVQLALSLS